MKPNSLFKEFKQIYLTSYKAREPKAFFFISSYLSYSCSLETQVSIAIYIGHPPSLCLYWPSRPTHVPLILKEFSIKARKWILSFFILSMSPSHLRLHGLNYVWSAVYITFVVRYNIFVCIPFFSRLLYLLNSFIKLKEFTIPENRDYILHKVNEWVSENTSYNNSNTYVKMKSWLHFSNLWTHKHLVWIWTFSL